MITNPTRQRTLRGHKATRPTPRAANNADHQAVLAWRLTPRDRWIIRMLHEHRVLTAHQITALAFPSFRSGRMRLRELFQWGVVDRFQPFITVGTAPMHYVLAPAGAAVLVRVVGRRNHRWSVTFLARWPSDRAMRHVRDRVRDLTRRSRLVLPVGVIVDEVNRFLRGWAAYFRYGNSAVRFEKIMHHVWTRMALVIAKRHKRSRAYGWSVLAYQSPDHLGLISLSGTVVAPRPFKDWREKPNAGGERRR
jgi:hypothetical protein